MSFARRWHRRLGALLVLPFLGWAGTGALFFLKPGWEAAYAPLPLALLPLDGASVAPAASDWLEVRVVRTELGVHLLARTPAGWRQLDPATRAPRASPTEDELRRLVEPALERAADPARLGRIARVDVAARQVVTDTGVRVDVDWERLALRQSGPDTDRIDLLYKVHYVQWTGVAALDRVLGALALLALVLLTLLGVRLLVGPRAPPSP